MVCEELMASQRNKFSFKSGKESSGPSQGVPDINLEVLSPSNVANDESYPSPVKTDSKRGAASQKSSANHSNYTMEDNDESDGEYSAEKEGPGKLGAVSFLLAIVTKDL